MHNYESVPSNVRGIVEFRDKSGSWTPALGSIKDKGPKIFNNKDEALEALLGSLLRIAALALFGRKVDIPGPDEFRFVPVEVPQSFDREPTDMMAASDVLKAAIAKAKSGGAV